MAASLGDFGASAGACATQGVLSNYLSSLTTGVLQYNYSEVGAGLEQAFGAGTLIVAGITCAFGRVLFGEDYLMYIMWLVTALVGCIIANASMSSLLVQILNGAASKVGLDAEGVCLVDIAFIVGSGVGFAASTQRMARAASFAAGFAAAGYGAFIGCGLLLPVLSPMLDVEVEVLARYAWVVVVASAIAGGLLFRTVAYHLIDLGLGAGGALLFAQGCMSLIAVDGLVSPTLSDALGLPTYLAYYQAGIALLLFGVRHALIGTASPSAEAEATDVYHELEQSSRRQAGKAGQGLIAR